MGDRIPLVSIIIPAYNAAETIVSTLCSVTAQTYPHIEIIVVDDGSRDDTASIVRQLGSADPRIRLITQPNAGVAAARNAGIEQASGEFVAPIDADDLWHPTKIEKQMQVMLGGGDDLGFVYCFCRLIDAQDKVICSQYPVTCRGRALHRHLFTNFVGNGSALLTRKSVVLRAGGYDTNLRQRGAEGCEDLLLQLKVAREYSVDLVPEYLVGYRVTPSSMSQNDQRMLRSWMQVMQIMRHECRQVPRFVFDWGAAGEYYRYYRLARTGVARGQARDATQALIRAFRLDPGGTGVDLLRRSPPIGALRCRLGRLRRKLRRMPPVQSPNPKAFHDSDPADVAVGRRSSVDKRRLKLLARLDGQLTQA